ncbi:hypothetical protein JYU34_001215 [Plutella xylostella]|uniref:Uncharacterized protein n=1 Tax=Plutella xylostella TaxID=51655 RepID=A0ABQ7R6A2_PLUXY|nr:hypothetical protein JYU34_001215 [Plutella xylostella]
MTLPTLLLTIALSASFTSAQLFRRSILPSPPLVQKILPAPCDRGLNLLKTASNLNRAVYPQEVFVNAPCNRPVLQPFTNQVQVIPNARPVVPNTVVSPVPQFVASPGNVVSVPRTLPAYPQYQVPAGNPFLPAASPVSALAPPTSNCLPPATPRNNRNNFLRKIPIPPPMC